MARIVLNGESIDSDKVSGDVLRLNQDSLRELLVGVYQLKNAKSYTQEHINDQGGYEILVHSAVCT